MKKLTNLLESPIQIETLVIPALDSVDIDEVTEHMRLVEMVGVVKIEDLSENSEVAKIKRGRKQNG